MPKIVITEPAQSDLDDIYTHYAPLMGEAAAEEIIIRILEQLEPLETYPGMGRPSLVPDVREVVITRYPYIAPYRYKNGEIQVLRVIHQRCEQPENW